MSNITVNGQLDPKQIDLLKRTICKDATDDELGLFLQVAKRSGLDPFTKQIYMIKRWNNKSKQDEMTIGTGIDGFRLIADRSGSYEGQTEPQWCSNDGAWTNVWLKKDFPAAARVGVYKNNFKEPLYAVARWDSYAQTYFKDGKTNVSPIWAKMPDLMLSKVAEALALRKAFPNELSGLYTNDEMAQIENENYRIVEHKESLPAEALTYKTHGVVVPASPVKAPIKNYAPQTQDEAKELELDVLNGQSRGQVKAELDSYIIKFGKWSGLPIRKIKLDDLNNYRSWITKKAAETGKPITTSVQEFLDQIELLNLELSPKNSEFDSSEVLPF